MIDETYIVPHSWKTNVNCMIYVEDMFLMNKYKFEIGFDTSTDNPVLHDIAFEKLEMFFNILMNNSIITNKENFLNKKFDLNNNIIEVPSMINDQTVGSIVFFKIKSIIGEDLDIQYVKLSSKLGKSICYTINDSSPEINILIPNKEEWWNDNSIKHNPWWLRSDTSTYDELFADGELYKGEFSWEEHFEDYIEEAKSQDPKSKFKIINGGKDEIKPSK